MKDLLNLDQRTIMIEFFETIQFPLFVLFVITTGYTLLLMLYAWIVQPFFEELKWFCYYGYNLKRWYKHRWHYIGW